jgi:hypothetical protein
MSNRANNGSVERRRLVHLVKYLNLTLRGEGPLQEKFRSQLTNLDINVDNIEQFVAVGGSCNHYDIKIIMVDGTFETIEHKGISLENFKGVIKKYEQPWSITPQLINAPYNWCPLSLRYCELWYNTYMPKIKSEYPELPTLPSYEEWCSQDASMGSAKTAFGKALKSMKANDDTSTVKRFIDQCCLDAVNEFWRNVTQDELAVFNNAISEKMTTYLADKDLWMNCFYKTSAEIENPIPMLTRTPNISNINAEIELRETKRSLVKLTYNLSSNPSKLFHGQALLRWGNGNGISNIRWNIR